MTINSEFFIAFPNNVSGNGSDILANARRGNGGNIEIATESIFGIQERAARVGNETNDIDASSDFNVNGNVFINTPDNNIFQGDLKLPSRLIENQQTVSQICRSEGETVPNNGFTIEGKGGIVPDPKQPLNSLNIYVDDESISSAAIPAPIKTSYGKIQPARGIKVSESGNISLTAYRTNTAGDRLTAIRRNCDRS